MRNKKVIQDILPASRRSPQKMASTREHISTIREIEIARPPHKNADEQYERPPLKKVQPIPKTPQRRLEREDYTQPISNEGRKRGPRYSIWISSFIAIGILAAAFSMILSGANVTVYPKKESAFFNGTIRADKAPDALLTFEVMSLTDTASEVIPSVKEASVKEYAKGEVTIINTYSPDSQRLIGNTRFETTDKKIYRIREAVEVPGLTKNTNGEVIPGKVVTTLYADAPGEEYNVQSAKMTIPGFSGSPRFSGFEAITNTPFTGGYNGIKRIADDAVITSTRSAMTSTLLESLEKKLLSEKKDGFYVNPDLVSVAIESAEPKNADSNESVLLEEKVTAHYIMLDELALAKALASATLTDYNNEDVSIENLSDLEISLATPISGDSTSISSVQLSIKGTVQFKWLFDAETLKNDLAGKNRQALYTVLSGYPSIDKAEVTLRPFWKQAFPVSAEDISINNALD